MSTQTARQASAERGGKDCKFHHSFDCDLTCFQLRDILSRECGHILRVYCTKRDKASFDE